MTGAPRPESLRPRRLTNPEHAIQCPAVGCKAPAGRPCATPKGRPVSGGSHPSRLDAWIAQRVTAAEARREAS